MAYSLVSTPTPRSAPSPRGRRASCHPHQSTTTMRRTALYLLVGAGSATPSGRHDSRPPPSLRPPPPGPPAPPPSRSGRGRSEQTLLPPLTIPPDGETYHLGNFEVRRKSTWLTPGLLE